MSIRLEYIVCNKNGDELNRFDVKADAEAYDSVICAAEDISLLLEPLQKKLSLNEDQIYGISEHLAFQSDAVKLALKQIKKSKAPVNLNKKEEVEPEIKTEELSEKKAVTKKAVTKKSAKKK
ncbi:MAG: YebG family protein [Gammaproteobacteria bacterium]|nr:YebG family protein [Gammaproteobacteria bacterium]